MAQSHDDDDDDNAAGGLTRIRGVRCKAGWARWDVLGLKQKRVKKENQKG